MKKWLRRIRAEERCRTRRQGKLYLPCRMATKASRNTASGDFQRDIVRLVAVAVTRVPATMQATEDVRYRAAFRIEFRKPPLPVDARRL